MTRFRLATFIITLGIARGLGAQEDSSYSKASELSLTPILSMTTRATSEDSAVVQRATGTLRGAQLVFRDLAGAGLMLRYSTGTLSGVGPAAGRFVYIDGRLLVGNDGFSIVPGYIIRESAFAGVQRRMGLARIGARIGHFFAGSGVMLSASGAYISTIKKESRDSVEARGIEGETSLKYVLPRLPFILQLSYQREVFNLLKQRATLRREELTRVSLGIGLHRGLLTR